MFINISQIYKWKITTFSIFRIGTFIDFKRNLLKIENENYCNIILVVLFLIFVKINVNTPVNIERFVVKKFYYYTVILYITSKFFVKYLK